MGSSIVYQAARAARQRTDRGSLAASRQRANRGAACRASADDCGRMPQWTASHNHAPARHITVAASNRAAANGNGLNLCGTIGGRDVSLRRLLGP